MKIAVCVKQVPDATSVRRLDAVTNRLDRSGEGALNATDVNAVEEALRIKEAHGGEVVVDQTPAANASVPLETTTVELTFGPSSEAGRRGPG